MTDKQKATDIIRQTNDLMSTLDDDLDHDYSHNLAVDAHRRLDRLESSMATGHRPTEKTLERGERILAKAQEVGRHIMTPEGILETAQRVMTNPNDIGIVSGYLAVGTQEAFAKAAQIVGDQMDRNDAAHAVGVIDGMTRDFERNDDLHELRGALEALRQDFAGLLDRIDRLERAPSAAPTQVVAKAQGGRTSRPVQATAASLLSRGQGVIDSPNTIGILSGLLEAGNLAEAQRMVEAAELDHEARVKTAERLRLR